MIEEFFSELHRAAIDYARDGFPVFVCKAGAKLPATPNGFQDATTDEATINRWYRENPTYNIGWCPENNGMGAIDAEATDLANWEKLEAENGGHVNTFTNRTPRGGLHLIYEGTLPPTVKRAFNGYNIDTRGRGSYILLPPSCVGGNEYETIDFTPPAPLPDWIKARVNARPREKQLAPEGVVFDISTNLAAARDWLGRQTPPVEGERNDATFVAACQIKDLGCSPQTTYDLLRDWETTLEVEELETIVASAFKNGQNAPGCDATRPMAEAFANVEMLAEPQPKLDFYDLEDDPRMDATPTATFLFDKVLPERGSVLMYGPTKQYKSFLLLDLALALATGLEGWGIKPTRTGPVVYSALEGRESLKRDRRRAWRVARGIEGTTEFYVNRAPMIKQSGAVEAYIAAIEKRLEDKKPVAIFLETAAKIMVGLDPTRDVPLLVAFVDRLVEHFGCVVVCSHHTGNNVELGPKDSSTYMQAFDTVIAVSSPGRLVAQAKIEKHKDSEEVDIPFTFQGHKQPGGSLAFFRTTLTEHKAATKKDDSFAPAKVGAALRELKAIGVDYAVDTKTLAGKLVPFLENDTLEEHDAVVDGVARKLVKLSKNLLEAYKATGKGGL